MATELAVTGGFGTIVLDVRRGDGPPGCFDYTMPVLAATERLVEESPDIAAAAVRALVATQDGAEGRRLARHRSWREAVSAARDRADRRHRRA